MTDQQEWPDRLPKPPDPPEDPDEKTWVRFAGTDEDIEVHPPEKAEP